MSDDVSAPMELDARAVSGIDNSDTLSRSVHSLVCGLRSTSLPADSYVVDSSWTALEEQVVGAILHFE